jgi:glycine C-acetyltransferase
MLSNGFESFLKEKLRSFEDSGVYKKERLITSSQGAHIKVQGQGEVLNLCANNYLGLSDHPAIVKSAHEALDQYGYGMSSVRFICGTTDLHRDLEKELALFLGKEDCILYGSCFDANGGLFEALLSEEDGVISDSLNHASIIDGIRLCRAKRWLYANNDMNALEEKLKSAQIEARFRLVITDGVFSMDGTLAPLKDVTQLAQNYGAMVCVDDSHSVGFMGEGGRGTHEYWSVVDQVDILTGTFGKALGGGLGGYTAGPKEVIDLLRQRSRPYLFSNSLPPLVLATAKSALALVMKDSSLRGGLKENAQYFRLGLEKSGFDLIPGDHPIIPVMFYDAKMAQKMASLLLEKGIYVVSFSYPVVPLGKARIRTQVSAAHSKNDLTMAIQAFTSAKKELGI